MVKITRLFTRFSYYLHFKALQQNLRSYQYMPIKTVRICKQIYKYKAFHLPVCLILYLIGNFRELEHNFQPGIEAKSMTGCSIPSTGQNIQTSSKNPKHKRRSIRFSYGIINSLKLKTVAVVTYCCRPKAQTWKLLPHHCSSRFYNPSFYKCVFGKHFQSIKKLVIWSGQQKATCRNWAGIAPEDEELQTKVWSAVRQPHFFSSQLSEVTLFVFTQRHLKRLN